MMESLAVEKAGTSRELLESMSRESERALEMESASTVESLLALYMLSLLAKITESGISAPVESGSWRNTRAPASGAEKAAINARANRYFRKNPFIKAVFSLYL